MRLTTFTARSSTMRDGVNRSSSGQPPENAPGILSTHHEGEAIQAESSVSDGSKPAMRVPHNGAEKCECKSVATSGSP
jgi:hypothetical protein